MKKNNKFLHHELLDRTSLLINFTNEMIGSNKILKQNKKYKKLYKKIDKTLNRLYQQIGKDI